MKNHAGDLSSEYCSENAKRLSPALSALEHQSPVEPPPGENFPRQRGGTGQHDKAELHCPGHKGHVSQEELATSLLSHTLCKCLASRSTCLDGSQAARSGRPAISFCAEQCSEQWRIEALPPGLDLSSCAAQELDGGIQIQKLLGPHAGCSYLVPPVRLSPPSERMVPNA